MSTLNVSNITDGTTTVGTSYVVNGSAKAWVVYGGTTPAINSSYNVSSLTDDSQGIATITFTNGFSTANLSIGGTKGGLYGANAMDAVMTLGTVTSSTAQNRTGANSSLSYYDPSAASLHIQGDLA
jgi:hypothetical protein